ncbi:Sec63 [Geranomyces michiganensis]|nr:Sec63 [Geranomyces michiganensis]
MHPRTSSPTPFPTPSSIRSRHAARELDQSLYIGEGRRSISRDFNPMDGSVKLKAGAFARSAARGRSPELQYDDGYDQLLAEGDRSFGYSRTRDDDPVFTGDIDLDISIDRGRRPGSGRATADKRQVLHPVYSNSVETRRALPGRENPYQLSDDDDNESDDLHPYAPPTWSSKLVPPLHTQSSQRQHQTTQPSNASINIRPPVTRSPIQTPTRKRGPTTASGIPLEPVSNLPDKFRTMFPFPFFNAVQSQCFNLAFRADRNLVVSAPTGSGKTCIMELAILRLLAQPGGENAKVIYVAPTKALCNERTKDWQQKFRVLGITCNELTGDTDNVRVNDIQRSNIIVTTPEKWDSMTRRWRDYKNLMALLRLILIDECHILNEAERGATLEVVVSRMRTVNIELRNDKTKSATSGHDMRFVAISATAPNIADIAAWLKDAQGAPADVRVFGEEYRPVQLRKEVLSYYSTSSNYFQFDTVLDSKLMEVIEKFSNGKPVLIVGVINVQLVVHGIAFHNGGMSKKMASRAAMDVYLTMRAIETDHQLKSLLGATSTLAVGVNLPAHLVIIKGTMQYNGTECTPYSEFDITQMLGRAGRPQFDDTGTAVIMTDIQNMRTYQDMVSGKQVIESKLHENLIEHLNSEVVLGAVQNTKSVFDCVSSVRMRKNPAHYKLKNCTGAEGRLSAEQRLESICLRDLELLKTHGLIIMSPETGNLKATEIGESMARYYIKFATAVTVLKMRPKAGLSDALETLCRAEEFSGIRFRSDKTQLNTLNKNKSIRFPVSGRVGRVDQKINVLIQIESIGPATAKMLATAGICTFDKLAQADPRSLEMAVNRNPPFGNKVQDLASLFPRFSLQVSQFKDLAHPTEVELYVNAGLSNAAVAKTYGKKGPVQASCIISLSDHTLVDYRRIPMTRLKDGESFRVRVHLTSATQKLMCMLVNEEAAGLDVRKEIVPDVRPIHFLHHQIKNSRKTEQTQISSPNQTVHNLDDASSEEFGDDVLLDDSQFAALTCQAVNITIKQQVVVMRFLLGTCAHECCKTGIPLVQARKRKKKTHAVEQPIVPAESADQSGWTDDSDFDFSGPTNSNSGDACLLPSEKVYNDLPLTPADVYRDLASGGTSPGQTGSSSHPLRVPSITPPAKKRNLSARTPTRPRAAMFIDAEASHNGLDSGSSFLSEQEGEFDGFIVDDDDDQLQDNACKGAEDECTSLPDAFARDIFEDDMEMSSDQSFTTNRRSKKRALVFSPSSEIGLEESFQEVRPTGVPDRIDESFFNDSPLQKRRRTTSTQDVPNLPVSVAAAATRKASLSSLDPTSIEARSKPSGTLSRKTSRQPWKNDPFAFDDDHAASQQQPLQEQLGALNRLHERTAKQNGMVPPQSLQTSRLRQRALSSRSDGAGTTNGSSSGPCPEGNEVVILAPVLRFVRAIAYVFFSI